MEIRNKKAHFEYEIVEKYIGGIVLIGSEVKSIRNGTANISDAYIKERDGRLYLWNSHIPQYKNSNINNYDPYRERLILMKKAEYTKISTKIQAKKLTAIPLRIFPRGKILKIEFALCKGKKIHQKREDEKVRTINQERSRQRLEFMV